MTEPKYNNSLCWKIEKTDEKPSYIFGSIHQMNIDKIPLALAKLEGLLSETKALCIEADFDEAEIDTTSQSLFGGSDKLHDVVSLLGEKHYVRLLDILNSSVTSKDIVPILDNVPLSLIALMVTVVQQQSSEFFSLDNVFEIEKHFTQLAKKQKYPIFTLETVAEQTEWLTATPEASTDDDVAILKKIIDAYDDPTTPDMYARYASEDLRLLRDEDMTAPMMVKRNEVMANRLAALLGKQSLLVIIGAAHLAGETGVLEGIEKHGYMVTPYILNNVV